MQQINIDEAEKQLAELVAAVENGEEVIIARSGEPVAKLVSCRKSSLSRTPGSAKGKFTVPEEFFDPLPEDILESFGQ